jgi:hypothetical protein
MGEVQPSLRDATAAIRHLDAVRARQLVALFARPVVCDGVGLAYDGGDPVVAATEGELSLETSDAHRHSTAVLGSYSTHIFLHGLLRLPRSVARVLARHRGHLYLDKLVSITDTVAGELSRHKGGGLSLNNLQGLSVAAAWALGRHAGELSLNRLRTLDPDAASGLAQHQSRLDLQGLRWLSSEAAAALAQHRGDITFHGLTTLTGRIASHLGRHRGKLHVHGVASLSAAAAEAFGRRQGYLCLQGVERLSPTQARLLAGHRGPLLFDRLDVDDAVAACLGRHEGSLAVNVRHGITLQGLESLMQHVGQVCLVGLTAVDERQARVLAAQADWHGLPGLSGLFLNGVKEITPSVAAILAGHRAGGLSLGSIEILTEDLARELVRHPLLCLDGVAGVTDRVAGILAAHSGATLSLKGLKNLSPSSLAKLRENPGIELPRRLYGEPARPNGRPPATAQGLVRPGRQELFRIIEQIASQGEAALRPNAPPTEGLP